MGTAGISYISVGSIKVQREEDLLDNPCWKLEDHHQSWRLFDRQEGLPSSDDAANSSADRLLHAEIQETLLKLPRLGSAARLFRAQWAKLEFRVNSESEGTLRVYLLPDDVERRAVDRSNPSLRATRLALLRELDFSKSSWNGVMPSTLSGNEALCDVTRPSQSTSLLELFNKIPSPSPDSQVVRDDYARDAMVDLLEGKVSGLKTDLYPYQRRSAAMMLQKESHPGRILDPRLIHVQDQRGSSFYLDPVVGTIFLEPRYYDGVSGGILAEEMGSGKTIMCLALILATKDLPTPAPDVYGPGKAPPQKRVASLAELAARCATSNAVPWKPYFDACRDSLGLDFSICIDLLRRYPGYYLLPCPEPRRSGRKPSCHPEVQSKRIFLSSCSLVIVPNNLIVQWQHEIQKHTDGLAVLTLVKEQEVPAVNELLNYDVILMSQPRFEKLVKADGGIAESSLSKMHFKRCMVDEGHKLGNSRIGSRSNLLLGLNSLQISSRWVVTGTPSHGLFGVGTFDSKTEAAAHEAELLDDVATNQSSTEMEKKDLERIGSIAALYLKARPWANTISDSGDTLANWTTYLMLPKHNPKSHGNWDCLTSTLNALIIRHQLAEIGDLLPSVNEDIVVLDGSFQDRLSLNLFSMMIIFNSVQSQRTDMDYFFHSKQRKSLMQIVHNLKQTSFFGGSFFTPEEISKSIETAETFLKEKKVYISPEDEVSLQEAIKFGRLAVTNRLRNLSNQFHEMPVLIQHFPVDPGRSWSLDNDSGDLMCTSASMLLALQKLVYDSAAEPEYFNSLMNGGLAQKGLVQREKIMPRDQEEQQLSKEKKTLTLAGNTKLGDDSPRKSRLHGVHEIKHQVNLAAETFPGPLEMAEITSTVSAKLSYLLDVIVRYQNDEKIIVFYENENIAWYLASMLDVVRTILFVIHGHWLTYLASAANPAPHLCQGVDNGTESAVHQHIPLQHGV